MTKFSTKSRLELAQLKRQLDSRRKQTNTAPDAPIAQQGESVNADSRFDYKFVFTNSAMQMEDKVFRVKNPTVALERDMKVVKPMAATSSFLPYGVTIRNPHMFEEDQLAVIQRRQEVQKINYSTTGPYNPFSTGNSSRSRTGLNNIATGFALTNRNFKIPDGVPKIPNRYSLSRSLKSSDGKMNPIARKPLVSYRSLMTDDLSNTRAKSKNLGGLGTASTTTRDSEFRKRFDALEAQRVKELEKNQVTPLALIRERSQVNTIVIDKLSNTVQQLNRYEERLKHYLKSKNTMVHAGAALKQLRFKRSKTIAQLSKLAGKETTPQTSDAPEPQTDYDEAKETYFEEASQKNLSKNNRSISGTASKRPSPRVNHNHRTMHREKIGSQLLRFTGDQIGPLVPKRREPPPKPEDRRMMSGEAAVRDGVELANFSSLLSLHRRGDECITKLEDFQQPKTTAAPGPSPRGAKTKPESSTVSLYRYNVDEPSSSFDDRGLVNMLEKRDTDDPNVGLFIRTNPSGIQDVLESKRSSEVIRRAYQDFQIHQDKVQTELLRDQSRRMRSKLQTSNRGMAELSEFMQQKALEPRITQRVRP